MDSQINRRFPDWLRAAGLAFIATTSQPASGDYEEMWRLWSSAIIQHAIRDATIADAALRELLPKYAESAAYQIAEVHAARGEIDLAFEWLERAYVQRDGGLTETKTDRLLRRLHADPRWGVFLRKIGLPE